MNSGVLEASDRASPFDSSPEVGLDRRLSGSKSRWTMGVWLGRGDRVSWNICPSDVLDSKTSGVAGTFSALAGSLEVSNNSCGVGILPAFDWIFGTCSPGLCDRSNSELSFKAISG